MKPETIPTQQSSARQIWRRELLRIGHSGAAAHAPPNTLKSFALALDMGVDVIEFDVRPCRDALVLVHDDELSALPGGEEMRVSQCSLADLRTLDAGDGERIPTLAEAVRFLKGKALMNVDVKVAGCESDVLDVLQEEGVVGDVLISSGFPDRLKLVKRLEPEVRTALAYPRDRGNVGGRPALQPAIILTLKLLRLWLPFRVLTMLAEARADAAMLHYLATSRTTVDRVHASGASVFVWTVDELSAMRRMRAMGVDGIVSNRPDLFSQLS